MLRIRGNNSETWKFYFTLRGSRLAKCRTAFGWFPPFEQNIPGNVMELLRRVPKYVLLLSIYNGFCVTTSGHNRVKEIASNSYRHLLNDRKP